MDESRIAYDDEIDLIELFQTIWDGKLQIFASVFVSLAAVGGYQILQPPPSFLATTEIKPISSIQAERYRESNAVDFFKITPNTLLDLYIEQLEEGVLVEEAIENFNLVDRSQYADQQNYRDAVASLAGTLELLPPTAEEGAGRSDQERRFWTLTFEHHDEDGWIAALTRVHQFASEEVRRAIHRRFESSLSIAKMTRDFELEDIQTQIENARRDFDKDMQEFELKHGFELEDIQTQIDNALADYEQKTSNRLAFLREQAAIARKLGVAKNTIEAQTFTTQSGMVANVKTDTPFYFRGYEAIEKEIELIESRTDTRAFVQGLLELEQKKRTLEQDQTLQRADKNKEFLDSLVQLENQRRALEQDRTLERAETLFASTPIIREDTFNAVSVAIETTEFEYQNRTLLMLALAVVIGGMVGVLYVLIRSAMNKRKQSHA